MTEAEAETRCRVGHLGYAMFEPVLAGATHHDRVERRKIFTQGTISHEGIVTARAEGIFISVDFAKIAEMMGRRKAEDS